jgi:hypothetical protein
MGSLWLMIASRVYDNNDSGGGGAAAAAADMGVGTWRTRSLSRGICDTDGSRHPPKSGGHGGGGGGAPGACRPRRRISSSAR